MQRFNRKHRWLVLCLVPIFCSSCATVQMWDAIGPKKAKERRVVNVERYRTRGGVIYAQPGDRIKVREDPARKADYLLMRLIVAPITLAWDILTLPIQVYGGYIPYGTRAYPDVEETIEEEEQ